MPEKELQHKITGRDAVTFFKERRLLRKQEQIQDHMIASYLQLGSVTPGPDSDLEKFTAKLSLTLQTGGDLEELLRIHPQYAELDLTQIIEDTFPRWAKDELVELGEGEKIVLPQLQEARHTVLQTEPKGEDNELWARVMILHPLVYMVMDDKKSWEEIPDPTDPTNEAKRINVLKRKAVEEIMVGRSGKPLAPTSSAGTMSSLFTNFTNIMEGEGHRDVVHHIGQGVGVAQQYARHFFLYLYRQQYLSTETVEQFHARKQKK